MYNPYTMAIMIVVMIPTLKALLRGAPFVPTPMEAIKKMLTFAELKPGSKIYDIGCGDGRSVYLAAKDYQAEAVGLELSPLVYCLAKIRKFFWRSKAKIKMKDFYFYNLSDADAIVCYLLPETLKRLKEKLEAELKPGTKIISYAFQMQGWKEKHLEQRNPELNMAPIWVYEIPAKNIS